MGSAKRSSRVREYGPVVLDLVEVVLNLVPHARLLMCQPLVLLPHDPKFVFQQSPPGDDIGGRRVENVCVNLVLLLFLLLIDIHFGIISIRLLLIVLLLLLFLVISLQIFEVFEGSHFGGVCVRERWRESLVGVVS